MITDKVPVYIQDSTEQIGFLPSGDFVAGSFNIPLFDNLIGKDDRLEVFLVKSPIGLMGIIQNMSINDITKLGRQQHIKLTEYARGALDYGALKQPTTNKNSL